MTLDIGCDKRAARHYFFTICTDQIQCAFGQLGADALAAERCWHFGMRHRDDTVCPAVIDKRNASVGSEFKSIRRAIVTNGHEDFIVSVYQYVIMPQMIPQKIFRAVQSLFLGRRYVSAAVSGTLLPLAFAPFSLWPVAFICPALLFLLWTDLAPKRALGVGFWFGMGAFGTGTYWLYNSIYGIGHAPIALTLLIMLGMAVLMASYFTVFGYVQARWFPRAGAARYLLALPALWLLCEWWRGWFVSGFPWMSLGYSQIDTLLAGYAPVTGVYGIGLICALIAGAIALAIVGTRMQRVLGMAIVIAPWIISLPLRNVEWTAPVREPVTVAIVQGAVQQDLKWSQVWRDKTLARYYELSAPYFGHQLVVWPEAALPDISTQLVGYLNPLWGEAHAKNSDIIMGLLHYDVQTDQLFNGALALSDDVQWYHKKHLVPFGEYFPVPKFIRNWLRMMSLPYNDITAGAAEQKPLNAAGEKLAASICYEDGFGAEQLYSLREATLMVNITNDAWFGDSIAAPQHLEISRMRALEAGRDLIRAANDGISALIDFKGHVRATLPRFKAMVLAGSVQPRTGLTPYVRVGNWPVLAVSLLLALIALFLYRFQSASHPITAESL